MLASKGRKQTTTKLKIQYKNKPYFKSKNGNAEISVANFSVSKKQSYEQNRAISN